MTAPNLQTVEVKAFVPARDFDLSKRFYRAVGFSIPWSDDELAYLHHGNCSFLLQKFYVAEHTQNFQMHLLVENADDWWRHLQEQKIAETFGVAIGAPDDRPWRMRDFTLIDPSGVLWRIAHNLPV
ncbi:MAG: VOC family protein [Lysobacter sp.]